jgi:hypothetical protein
MSADQFAALIAEYSPSSAWCRRQRLAANPQPLQREMTVDIMDSWMRCDSIRSI